MGGHVKLRKISSVHRSNPKPLLYLHSLPGVPTSPLQSSSQVIEGLGLIRGLNDYFKRGSFKSGTMESETCEGGYIGDFTGDHHRDF